MDSLIEESLTNFNLSSPSCKIIEEESHGDSCIEHMELDSPGKQAYWITWSKEGCSHSHLSEAINLSQTNNHFHNASGKIYQQGKFLSKH